MPNTLPPLPPPDDTWPPRDQRRLHPETIEQVRGILRAYDAGAYDLATAVHKITRTVHRDGGLWQRDRPRPGPATTQNSDRQQASESPPDPAGT